MVRMFIVEGQAALFGVGGMDMIPLTAQTAASLRDLGAAVNDRERLAEVVTEFVDGWHERVEYHVRVGLAIEARAASVRQPGLIEQLTSEVSGYTPVSTGARWGQPGSRPPGTLDLLDLVNHIDAWLHGQDGLARRGTTRRQKLRGLVSVADVRGGEWTHEVLRDLRRFRKTARIMLQYDVPAVPLRDTVCGACGGTLVVAVDADSDVRCVGDILQDQPSCGMVYHKWAWVDLLED